MPSSKRKPKEVLRKSWRVSILRQRARQIGTVEAPNEKAALAAAISQFHLSEDQRRRLVVREED